MTDITKKFEQLIFSSYQQMLDQYKILPVKTAEGIQVGDILIKSEGTSKHLYKDDMLLYKDINLNKVAISMANHLASQKDFNKVKNLYRLDQDYGRFFTDYQILKNQSEKAKLNGNFDRAEILKIKHDEAKNRALQAKRKAESLASI